MISYFVDLNKAFWYDGLDLKVYNDTLSKFSNVCDREKTALIGLIAMVKGQVIF